VHALSGAPCRDVGSRAGGIAPAGFAAAVVAAVEIPEDEGGGGKAEDEHYEHYYPFVVG